MDKHKANIYVTVESTGKTYSTEIDVYKADDVADLARRVLYAIDIMEGIQEATINERMKASKAMTELEQIAGK